VVAPTRYRCSLVVKLKKLRAAGLVILTAGLVAAVFCLLGLTGESLPYQDPTPAMLAAQALSIRFWQVGFLTSLVVSMAGVVVIRREE
jgi:hypothetical protein